MKVAINGFGRIGRNFLRCVLQDPIAREVFRVVAINSGPAKKEFLAHMFKYDTIMGTYPGDVALDSGCLVIDGYRIPILSAKDPSDISWSSYQVDWVVEASGHFTSRDGAQKHINAGASRVLITAPAHDEDMAIIPGVNMQQFDATKHTIVSLGSCTTNALIPLLYVMHQAFTITKVAMTTTHAYTNSQVLLDVEGEDLRRSRAAALNIIPTSTGASTMLAKVLPELSDVVTLHAIRVPLADVSLIDLTLLIKSEISVEVVHAALQKASVGALRGILGLSLEPLVSSDYCGSNYSVVVDGLLTQTHGTMVKLLGWYDNEWGYSQRLKDFLCYAAGK